MGQRWRAWLAYAAAGLVVTAVLGGIASLMLESGRLSALWIAAGAAYGLQLMAFALLVRMRGQPQLFLVAWLGGMVLRFATVGLVAYWLSRNVAQPRATVLISFVGFVFVLLLLEPVFLRWDLRES